MADCLTADGDYLTTEALKLLLSVTSPSSAAQNQNMSKLEAKIHISIIVALGQYATHKGGNFDRLLADAGLSKKDFEDPDKMLPINAVANLFESTARDLSDPCLGLRLVEAMSHQAISLLGYLLATAPSGRGILECVAKYATLHVTDASFTFKEQGALVEASFSFPDSLIVPRIQLSSFLSSLLIKRIKMAIGANWHPLSVDIDHMALPCPELVRTAYGDRVSFDQPRMRMVLDLNSVSRRLPDRDGRLYEVMTQLADRMISEAKARTPLADEVRRLVMDTLTSGRTIDLDEVAKSLGMSRRALQVRLRQVDATFEQIVTEARKAIAMHYLQDTKIPLTHIALSLGFSELSAFTRAARRWFGVSPKVVRQRAHNSR